MTGLRAVAQQYLEKDPPEGPYAPAARRSFMGQVARTNAAVNAKRGDLATYEEEKREYYEAARDAALKATSLSPRDADKWCTLALANERLGDLATDEDRGREYYEAARDAALSATSLSPRDAYYRLILFRLNITVGWIAYFGP